MLQVRGYRLFLLSIVGLFAGNAMAMEGVNLKDHALPNNSVRAKLDSIFQGTTDSQALAQDATFKDFNSWHWLVGQLTTAGNNTPFVVKAANHPAGVSISRVGVITPQIHTAQQNLSRIKKGAAINGKNMPDIRAVNTWVYPKSGNDTDLANPNITDQDVVIVEEFVKKKSNNVENAQIGNVLFQGIQSDTRSLTPENFNNLVAVAQEHKILDLTPNNYFIDENGKVVFIDLEDTLASTREKINNANFFIRPIKKFKLNCQQDGSVKVGLALTGILQHNPQLQVQGSILMGQGMFDILIKRNALEVGTVSMAVAAAIRHHYYVKKVANLIKDCRAEIEAAVNTQKETLSTSTENQYVAIAASVMQKKAPQEKRQEIVNAFATIAVAEDMRAVTKVTILGKEYISSKDAVAKSVAFIDATWKSDWSLRAKVVRGVKALSNKVQAFFDKKGVQPQVAVAAAG